MSSYSGPGEDCPQPGVQVSSSSQRNALNQHLVEPLFNRNYHGVAIRIVWRSRNREENDSLWRMILSYRMKFDEIMKGLGRVKEMPVVISCISGLCNNPKKDAQVEKAVYPACAYCILTPSPLFSAQDIVMALAKEAMAVKADVRYLSSPDMTSKDEIYKNICKVFKDHSGPYVRMKVMESQQALGLSDAEVGSNAKLFMNNATQDLQNIVTSAQENMSEAKIYLDLYK